MAHGRLVGSARSLQYSTDGITWTEVHNGGGEDGVLVVSDHCAYSLSRDDQWHDWGLINGANPSSLDFKAPSLGLRTAIYKARVLSMWRSRVILIGGASGIYRFAMFMN